MRTAYRAFLPRRAGIYILTPPGVSVSTVYSTLSVSNSSVVSGSSRTVTLQLKDTNNVNMSNATGLTITPTAAGGGSTGTLGSVTDNGDGTLQWTYTGILSGSAQTLGAKINGVAITSTLPTITVTPGAIDRTVSVVTINPQSSATEGATGVFLRLQAKDAAGNNLAAGGSTVAFGHSGGTSVITIGAVTDNSNGTYDAPITCTTQGTATTFSATIGGQAVTTTMPTLTVTAQYQAGSILDNVGFEGPSWSGFTDGSGQTGPTPTWGPFTTDQTHVYAGSYAFKRSLVPSGSDSGPTFSKRFGTNNAQQGHPGCTDRLYGRFWFYFDGLPDSAFKFNILEDSSSFSDQFGGIYIDGAHGGKLAWVWAHEMNAQFTQIATITLNTWHSIEWDCWLNGDDSQGGTAGVGWPSVAMWYDDVNITGTLGGGNPPSPGSWHQLNGVYRLYAGQKGTYNVNGTKKLGTFNLAGILNGGNTVTAGVWIDRVSVSTLGRVGP